jgi:spore coat protein U-like protein
MSNFNSKLLAVALTAAAMVSATGGAIAATTSGTVDVSATLAAGCEVSAGGTISFGSIVALASTGNQAANSGSTFKVACSKDVAPTIATSTTRSMADTGTGTHLLPFKLSLTNTGTDDLGSATPTALTITQDGTPQTVTLYATILASDFSGANALPLGAYTKTMTIDVAY